MFSPRELDLERGWPGKIEGDHVIQLAAQTLQAFFSGGGTAREHAEYPLRDVLLRAPVLHPPVVRVFDGGDFRFANAGSVYGPGDEIPFPEGAEYVEPEARYAALLGGDEAIGGFTIANDWVAVGLLGAKARDFALSLGPVVVTPDELTPPGVPWHELIDYARRNTRLLPGDVIAADVVQRGAAVRPGDVAECALDGLGALRNRLV
jgi:2-keto-4-pentenoate hydratase/2-oxohepta-3-ene-1,7-dioic acid hydratase in catechol pathway